MSFKESVIDLISSSDSEDLERACAPLQKSKKTWGRHVDLSPSSSDDSDDNNIPPLFERLKKLKSLDLPDIDPSCSQDSVPPSSTLWAFQKPSTSIQTTTSNSSCAAPATQRLVVASQPKPSLFSHVLSSDDDDDDDCRPILTTQSTFSSLSSSSSSLSRLHSSDGRIKPPSISLINRPPSNVNTLPDILDDFDVNDTARYTSSQTTSSQSSKQSLNAKSQANRREADLRKAAKTRQREEAKTEKERQKRQKQLDRDRLKSAKPGESVNYMKVILDGRLLELPEAADITKVLTESNIRYVLENQLVPFSVTWRREIVEKNLGENLQVEEKTSAVDEDQALVLITTEQFVEGIHHFVQKRTNAFSVGQTLRQIVHQFKCIFPGKKITIIIPGMEQYFRTQKSRENRAYREIVRGGGKEIQKATKRQKRKAPDEGCNVSRIEVEEALVELQIEEPCNVRLLGSSLEIAQTIVTFTKAIAEAPYQRERDNSGLSFYANSTGVKPVKVDKYGKGLLLLWQRQIQQFNNVSADMAQAIVAEYPSPLALFQTYEQCRSPQEGEQLLKDIIVRRGAGPLATTRKIGRELSRRIYLFMTTYDGDLILS